MTDTQIPAIALAGSNLLAEPQDPITLKNYGSSYVAGLVTVLENRRSP